VGQRNVYDRGIEHLEGRAQHNCERDQPFVSRDGVRGARRDLQYNCHG